MKKLLSLLLTLALLTTTAAALASPNQGASPAFRDTLPAQTSPATGYQKQDANVPEYGWEQEGYTEVAATPIPFKDQLRGLAGQLFDALSARNLVPPEINRELYIENVLNFFLDLIAQDSQITEEMVLEQIRTEINAIKQAPPILLPPAIEAR